MKTMDLIWIPNTDFRQLNSRQFASFFEKRLEEIHSGIERDELSSSSALEGVLIELSLYSKVKFDWESALNELLLIDETPIAYSEKYGSRLHGFNDQWLQKSVSSAYVQFWIRETCGYGQLDFGFLANKLDTSGLYFDIDISPTKIRNRMKTEIAASTCMILEMNSRIPFLKNIDTSRALSALDDSKIFPRYKYLSFEYLRDRIHQSVGSNSSDSSNLKEFLLRLREEVDLGWPDFLMTDKIDDYMGTAKRTGRDKNVSSALLTNFVIELHRNHNFESPIEFEIEEYAKHLEENPFDIQAFKMRDLPYEFGPGLTVLEGMASLKMRNLYASK